MKRTFALSCMLFAALMLVLAACGGGGGGGGGGGSSSDTPAREWTYMVYMGADNNLAVAGLIDLNEMETVGSSDDVAIVLQAEFSAYYTQSVPLDVPTNTMRFNVQNDNDTSTVDLSAGQSIGNKDMGDPATLTAFINWAKQNYPAKHYALVVWDHGGGWKDLSPYASSSLFRGAVQDETSGSFMSLPDLAKGVRDSGVHFDIINFDACLMAMYEVAYEFKGLVDYMVFSEETEPGDGDPYDTILAALTANPTMSARTLASTIVDKYDAFYEVNDNGETTKSAVDMSEIDTLDTKIRALANVLMNDAASNAVAQVARDNTQHYAYTANHDLYDMAKYISDNTLATSEANSAADEIMTAMNTVVVNSKTNGLDSSKNHGLAIYLPTADETNDTDLAEYALLAANQTRASATGTWGEYVDYEITAEGGGTVTYGKGGFGLYLYWEKPDGTACNADLDLYVWEPTATWSSDSSGDLYAPYMGQTSPNGFFSEDSIDSGFSEEFYFTYDQIYYGDYYFIVNYWDDGSTCSQARAHLLWYDPDTTTWIELTSSNVYDNYGFSLVYPSPQIMDLSNYMISTPGTLFGFNAYSDFWVPDIYWGARSGSGISLIDPGTFPLGEKGSQIFRFGKSTRLWM